MAQGLAAVKTDGTGARILTHDSSVCPYGPCDGTRPPEAGFSDSCPLVLSDGRVAFTRSFEQGLITQVAFLDMKTGKVTVPDALPHVAPTSGCPSRDATGERIIYMSCGPLDKYGSCDDATKFTYVSVSASDPSVFKNVFPVPLIDSPNWSGTYSTTQCRYDQPAMQTLTCLGAN